MVRKFFGMWAALLFMVGVAAAVYLILDSIGGPLMKPVSGIVETVSGRDAEPVVGPYTTVKTVREYRSCGDEELYSRGPAEKQLVGLDYNRLQMLYPASGGWKVAFQDDELTITRVVEGYCGLHHEYRHLGIHEGKLTVYLGPLGDDGTLLRVERNIDVQMLPADWSTRLEKAARFDKLDTEEQLELRESLEFPDEHAMNMVIENFDEMDG